MTSAMASLYASCLVRVARNILNNLMNQKNGVMGALMFPHQVKIRPMIPAAITHAPMHTPAHTIMPIQSMR